jgi:hypothetical protein
MMQNQSAPGPARSVRASVEDARAIAQALSERERAEPGSSRRRDARTALPDGYAVLGTFRPLGGGSSTYALAMRDLSRSGLSFLHGCFLHRGTSCEFVLVGSDRAPLLRMNGSVVRCEHVRGTIHDVGVRFDQPAPLDHVLPGLAPEPSEARDDVLLALAERVAKAIREGKPADDVRRLVEQLARTFECADQARREKDNAPTPAPPTKGA